MVEGRISHQYEPLIAITVSTPDGVWREVEAVVGTGFNGYLALPGGPVEELSLPFLYSTNAFLADNTEITIHTHQATITWDGNPRTVAASAGGDRSLVGMQIMEGYQLDMDIRPDGALRIGKK